jgi:glycogen operon protein
MLLAGDEFARTQEGNNNAYCQDNEISWVDWRLREKNDSLVLFVRMLTALRHKYPILRRNLFLNGVYIEELGVRDVTWIDPNGLQMTDQHWHDPAIRCFGMLLDGRAPTTAIRQRGKEATILIVINGHDQSVEFTLAECAGAIEWRLLIDTSVPEPMENMPGFAIGSKYTVTARSLRAFVLETESSGTEVVRTEAILPTV